MRWIPAVCTIGLLSQAAFAAELPADHFGPSRHATEMPIAILNGTLIDGTGRDPRTDQTVLIENGRISAVGPSDAVAVPEDAHLIDASGMTVMPGLIASNQHVQLNPLHPAPVADMPLSELVARWERNFDDMPRKAYTYLMQGITTMRQTSGPRDRLLPLKKKIDAGELPGPRILLGGALITHAETFKSITERNRTPAESVPWLRDDFAWYVVEDVETDLAELMSDDYSYWKILFSHEEFDGSNDFTDEEVRRMIQMAKDAGMTIDIHANSTPEGYARLLKFDFDTLEHPFVSNFLQDEETIEGFAKKGVIVATLLRVKVAGAELAADPHRLNETRFIMSMDPEEYQLLMRYRDKMVFNQKNPGVEGLSIYDTQGTRDESFGMAGPSYDDQQAGREMARENMRRFIRAGVKFSMGTDAPTFLNFLQDDPNALELADMVELGMSPMEAILAGTRNGAESLNMLDKLGTVEEGKIADIILVAGNPLESMEAMKRVAVVIKDGVRYK